MRVHILIHHMGVYSSISDKECRADIAGFEEMKMSLEQEGVVDGGKWQQIRTFPCSVLPPVTIDRAPWQARVIAVFSLYSTYGGAGSPALLWEPFPAILTCFHVFNNLPRKTENARIVEWHRCVFGIGYLLLRSYIVMSWRPSIPWRLLKRTQWLCYVAFTPLQLLWN